MKAKSASVALGDGGRSQRNTPPELPSGERLELRRQRIREAVPRNEFHEIFAMLAPETEDR